MTTRPMLLLLPLTLYVTGATACKSQQPQEQTRTTLRVVSYPWIPDAAGDGFQALDAFLEQDFEARYPDIDLQLRPIANSFGVYELEDDDGSPGPLARWLTDDVVSSDQHDGEQGYHMVEVDTLLLGELVERGLIQPWSDVDDSDWHQSATEAVTIADQVYGVPRLICGHFLFARDAAVAGARTIAELTAALAALPADKRKIAGNWLGSWNATALYLDAWKDDYPEGNMAEAFGSDPSAPVLDAQVLANMQAVSDACAFDGNNYCTDGTFDDWTNPDLAARDFGRGDSQALFGYSERLHFILQEARATGASEDIQLSSIPLGQGTLPIMFADAFVMRTDCDERCREAAYAFVSYMNEPAIQEYVLASKDAGEAGIPRYLLPAVHSAYTDTALAQDPLYVALYAQITTGRAYINQGFYDIKDAVSCQIRVALGAAPCE